jgi:hypothetical protein
VSASNFLLCESFFAYQEWNCVPSLHKRNEFMRLYRERGTKQCDFAECAKWSNISKDFHCVYLPGTRNEKKCTLRRIPEWDCVLSPNTRKATVHISRTRLISLNSNISAFLSQNCKYSRRLVNQEPREDSLSETEKSPASVPLNHIKRSTEIIAN